MSRPSSFGPPALPRRRVAALLAFLASCSAGVAAEPVSLFDYDFSFRPWAGVRNEFAWGKAGDGTEPNAWHTDRWRNRAFVGNQSGATASLTRPFAAPVTDKLTIVAAYLWKAGTGAGQATFTLDDGAANAIDVVVTQGAGGRKYSVFRRSGDRDAFVGATGGEAVDLGSTTGGRLPPPRLTIEYDPATAVVGLRRDEASIFSFDTTVRFAPTRLVIRDTSPGNEGLRLFAVRGYTGDHDPRIDFRGLTLPWGNTFVEGSDPKAGLHFDWEGGADRRSLAVDLRVHEDGKPDATLARVESAEATVRDGVPISPTPGWSHSLPPGLYRIRGDVRVGGQSLPVNQRFAVVSAELSARSFEKIPTWVGINPYLAPFFDDSQFPPAFEFMKTIGVRHLRWIPGWGRVEPREGEYDFETEDLFMRLAKEHGMNVMIGLSYFGEPWAHAKVQKMAFHDDGRELWIEHYAKPVMRRYAGQVKHWQIWNEPDAFWNDDPAKATGFARGFGTPANYYDLLRRAIQAGREIDPSIKVMLSLATGRHEPGIKRMLALGLGSPDVPFAAINTHAYGATLKNLTNVRRILDELGHGHIPVGSGEVGSPDKGDAKSQQRSAAKLVEVMLGCATIPNLYGVDWFVMTDVAVENYGLLSRTLEPKPTVLAYHTISHLLSGASGVGTTDVAAGVRRFVIPRDGMSPLVGLLSVDGGQRRAVLRRSGDAPIAMWDLRGRRSALAFEGGRHALDLGPEVVLIEGDVTVEPTLDVALAPQPDGRLSVVIDGKLPATVRARVDVEVEGLGSDQRDGVEAGGGRVVLNYGYPNAKAGARYEAKARLTWPGGGEATAGRSIEFTTAARVTADEVASIRRPSRVAPLVVDAKFYEPLLNGRYDGDADCSAEFAFGWTDAHLVVWIDQRDDVFKPADPVHPWTEDGPQLAIDPQFERSPTASNVEISFGLGKDGKPLAFSMGEPRFEPDLLAERDEPAKRTRYRLMVPWQELGVTPAAGRNVGLAMILNDNDAGDREGWLGWGGGIGHEKNPATYRELVLAPAE